MRKKLLPLFYIAPLLLWMCLVFFASTQAGGSSESQSLIVRLIGFLSPPESGKISPETMSILNFVVRKTAHVTEYAILTMLAVRAIQYGEPRLKIRAVFGAAILGILYASSDEIHQRFVPGRTSSPVDVMIDSVGVCLVTVGVLLWFSLKGLERWLRQEPTDRAVPAKNA